MKKIIFISFAIIAFLASCSDKEGGWDEMLWKPTGEVVKQSGVYVVPSSESSISFTCKNYSSPWIVYAGTSDEMISTETTGNIYHAVGSWFEAEMTDNQLAVSFKPNETGVDKYLKIVVTAGDIFETFQFKQLAE